MSEGSGGPKLSLGKDPNEVADKIVRWLPIGALAALGIWGWGTIAPFLAAMMVNTTVMFASALAIGVMGVLTLHPKSRKVWWLGYCALTSKLRRGVIRWDPRTVVEMRLANVVGRVNRMSDVLGNLKGVQTNTIQTGKKIQQRLDAATERYEAAKSMRDVSEANLEQLATEVKLAEQELADNREQKEYVTATLDILKKVHETMVARVNIIRMEVDSAIRRFEASTQTKRATDAAISVLRPDPEDVKDFEEAMSFMSQQVDLQFGRLQEIDTLTRDEILKHRIDSRMAVRGADQRIVRLREAAKRLQETNVQKPGETAINLNAPAATNNASGSSYLNLGGR